MADRPNVVVVTTHDSGRHFGCYGVDTVHTPAVDTLAADGYRFTNFFAAAPQCSPSRAAMLTGRYPQRNGVLGLAAEPWGWSLADDATHLSERLRDAGYHTALFGLQHEDPDVDRLGFETVRTDAGPGPEVAAAVGAFLDDPPEPFYAQVGLFETHEPHDQGGAEPDYEDGVTVGAAVADDEAGRERAARFEGALRQADRAVGAIRDALADAGVAADTVFVFTSDHGPDELRAKGYCYDDGLGVPLVVRWPAGGVVGGETCDWLASNVDVVPTLLDLLGLPVPGDVDGVSLADAFADPAGESPREAVYALFHDHHEWGFGPEARCARTRSHKLVRNYTPDMRFDPPVSLAPLEDPGTRRLGRSGLKAGPRPPVELYDLDADPGERENVADDPDYAAVRAALDERLRAWLDATDDPVRDGPPGGPYYRRARET